MIEKAGSTIHTLSIKTRTMPSLPPPDSMLDCLPPELLLMTFAYLPTPEEAYKFSKTCRKIRILYTRYRRDIDKSIRLNHPLEYFDSHPIARDFLGRQSSVDRLPLSSETQATLSQDLDAIDKICLRWELERPPEPDAAVAGWQPEITSQARPRLTHVQRVRLTNVIWALNYILAINSKGGDWLDWVTLFLYAELWWFDDDDLLTTADATPDDASDSNDDAVDLNVRVEGVDIPKVKAWFGILEWLRREGIMPLPGKERLQDGRSLSTDTEKGGSRWDEVLARLRDCEELMEVLGTEGIEGEPQELCEAWIMRGEVRISGMAGSLYPRENEERRRYDIGDSDVDERIREANIIYIPPPKVVWTKG